MRIRLLVVVALTALLSLPLPLRAADLRESHCVVSVVDQLMTKELVLSESRCYRTLAEAMAAASAGSLTLPSSIKGDVLFSDREIALAVASFALGVHFEGASGTGSSITVTGSSCSGGWWNTGSSWANRISSSFNGCGRLAHYDLPNTGGAVENTYGAGSTDNLGALNNRTESVAYYSS